MEGLARRYLGLYRRQARLVITPLLHVASPCLAMGVPVVLVRRDRNARFSAIDRLIPLHTPEDIRRIDWAAQALELEDLKDAMTRTAGALLSGRAPDLAAPAGGRAGCPWPAAPTLARALMRWSALGANVPEAGLRIPRHSH